MHILLINVLSFSLIAMIIFLIFKLDKDKSHHTSSLITLAAILVALNISVKILLFPLSPFKIINRFVNVNVNNIFLALTGIFCGGMLGVFSGIANDFIGFITVARSGLPCLFFTLTSIINCILPHYLLLLIRKLRKNKTFIYLDLPISYGITSLLIYLSTPIVLFHLFQWANRGVVAWFIYYYTPLITRVPLDIFFVSIALIYIYHLFSVRIEKHYYNWSARTPVTNTFSVRPKKNKTVKILLNRRGYN